MLALKVLLEGLGVWHLCPADGAGVYQGSFGGSLLVMALFLLLSSLLFGIFLLRLNLLLSTSHIRAGPVWRPRDRAAREELGRTSREGRVEPRTAWGLRHPQKKERAEPGAQQPATRTPAAARARRA